MEPINVLETKLQNVCSELDRSMAHVTGNYGAIVILSHKLNRLMSAFNTLNAAYHEIVPSKEIEDQVIAKCIKQIES